MFDATLDRREEGGAARRALATALALAWSATVIAVGWLLPAPSTARAEALPPGEIALPAELGDPWDAAPADAPAPPARGVPQRTPGGGSGAVAAPSEAPDDGFDTVASPSPTPEEAVDDPALPQADGPIVEAAPMSSGGGGGVGPGEGGGTPDGWGPGGPGGSGTGAGPVVIHQDLTVRRRVQPAYPSAAAGLGLGDQRCVAQVHLDATGRPDHVAVEGCPRVFHDAVIESLSRWRWYPWRVEGRAVPATTRIAVVFQQR